MIKIKSKWIKIVLTVTANTAKMQCLFWNIIPLEAAMNGLPK